MKTTTIITIHYTINGQSLSKQIERNRMITYTGAARIVAAHKGVKPSEISVERVEHAVNGR